MCKYNVVMEMQNATVVSEYEPEKKRSDAYQSEAALEKEFIRMLTEQGYEYLQIHDSETLINNLRHQLELLNDYKFSESEWTRFFNNNIANNNDGIVEKTRKIQEDHIQVLNIFELGDALDGILRANSQLMQLRYGIIDSAILYADFLSTPAGFSGCANDS